MTQQRDGGQSQAEVSALLRAVGQLLVAISGDEPAANAPPPRPEAPPRSPSPMEEIEQILGDARARAQQLIDESLADARARLEALAGEDAPPAEQPPAEPPPAEPPPAEAGALDAKLRSLQELLGDIEALQRSGTPEPPAPDALPPEPAMDELAAASAEPEEPTEAVEDGAGGAERVEAVAWSEDDSEPGVRFEPEDGSVLLRVAPVQGFQGLLRVQGVLAQLPGVRQAFVEGYAEGEAQLRLTFDSSLAVDLLGAALGERLGVAVQAADVSEPERSLRFELR